MKRVRDMRICAKLKVWIAKLFQLDVHQMLEQRKAWNVMQCPSLHVIAAHHDCRKQLVLSYVKDLYERAWQVFVAVKLM